jgi:copper(I)-binding protein
VTGARLADAQHAHAEAALGAGCGSGGGAGPRSAAAISVSDAYVVEPAGDTAAAYFTLHNAGGEDDRLVGVQSDAAPVAMLHESQIDANGVATMGPLERAVVPAHGSLTFEPGGRHVMLDHVRPLHAGDHVQLTLTFASTGPLTVTAPVRPLGGAAPSTGSADGGAGAHSGH